MQVPFSLPEFLQVFEKYNQLVWPMQIALNVLAVISILLSFYKTRSSDKIISITLSFYWLWSALIYHLYLFTSINKAAYLFAGLFFLQSVLFFLEGVVQNKLSFNLKQARFGFAGMVLIFFSLFVYPVTGYFSGHVYPQSPTFGLPCPLTIFTFGCFMLMNKRYGLYLLLIPLLWSLIGTTAVLHFKFFEDTSLLISGVFAIVIYFKGRSRITRRRELMQKKPITKRSALQPAR